METADGVKGSGDSSSGLEKEPENSEKSTLLPSSVANTGAENPDAIMTGPRVISTAPADGVTRAVGLEGSGDSSSGLEKVPENSEKSTLLSSSVANTGAENPNTRADANTTGSGVVSRLSTAGEGFALQHPLADDVTRVVGEGGSGGPVSADLVEGFQRWFGQLGNTVDHVAAPPAPPHVVVPLAPAVVDPVVAPAVVDPVVVPAVSRWTKFVKDFMEFEIGALGIMLLFVPVSYYLNRGPMYKDSEGVSRFVSAVDKNFQHLFITLLGLNGGCYLARHLFNEGRMKILFEALAVVFGAMAVGITTIYVGSEEMYYVGWAILLFFIAILMAKISERQGN